MVKSQSLTVYGVFEVLEVFTAVRPKDMINRGF